MLFKINFEGHILITADSEEDARMYGNHTLNSIHDHADCHIVSIEARK